MWFRTYVYLASWCVNFSSSSRVMYPLWWASICGRRNAPRNDMRRNPKAAASKGDPSLSGMKYNGRLKIVYGKSVIKNEREYYLISKLVIFPCRYFGLHVLLSESSKMHVGISDENPNASIPVWPVFLVLFSLTTSIVKESGLFLKFFCSTNFQHAFYLELSILRHCSTHEVWTLMKSYRKWVPKLTGISSFIDSIHICYCTYIAFYGPHSSF